MSDDHIIRDENGKSIGVKGTLGTGPGPRGIPDPDTRVLDFSKPDIRITKARFVIDHPEYFCDFAMFLGVDEEGNEYIAKGIEWEPYKKNQKVDPSNHLKSKAGLLNEIIADAPNYMKPYQLPEIWGYETKVALEKIK